MTRRGSMEFEALINAALATLRHTPSQSPTFRHAGARKRSLDAVLITKAARRAGLKVFVLNKETQFLGDGKQVVGFYQNMPWTLTALDRLVTNDKLLTKRILEENHLPVASGRVVRDAHEAISYFRRIGSPVVVKPIAGSGGRGVTVDINDEKELVIAVQDALTRSSRVLVEESIPSIDLRITVVGGRTVAAMLRVPAHVEGNGVSSIRELVVEKNRVRSGNAYLRYAPIAISDEAKARLATTGLDLDSVIAPGRRVYFHYKANLSSGGDSFDVTDMVHPGILCVAEKALACFPGVVHAGVDVLTERLDQPPDAQRFVICEVNCNNDMPIHLFPLFGKSVDVARLEVKAHLPRDVLSHHLIGRAMWAWRRVAAPRATSELKMVVARQGKAPPELHVVPVSDSPVLDQVDLLPVGYGAPSTPPLSARRLDVSGLSRALSAPGWGQVRPTGKLIRARVNGREAVIERSGRSIFAGAVARRRAAVDKLLGCAGLAVCKASVLKPDQWDRALRLFQSAPGPWNLRSANNGNPSLARFGLRREETLRRAWLRFARTSARALLEQAADGHVLRLLLVAGDLQGCLLLAPLSLVGDGTSTVEQLIDRKVAARAQHLYLGSLPIRAATLREQNLRRRNLTASTVLPAGRKTVLSRSLMLTSGAETFGFSHCPEPGLVPLARRALSLVATPPIAAVTFATRPPDAERPVRHWAVVDIDPDPVIAQFVYPWAGHSGGDDIYKAVAGVLSSGPRYELSATSGAEPVARRS